MRGGLMGRLESDSLGRGKLYLREIRVSDDDEELQRSMNSIGRG